MSRGAAAVVAPLAVVSDAACADLVAALHHEWRGPTGIANALAAVRRGWSAHPTPARWGTAASFLCFGAGGITALG